MVEWPGCLRFVLYNLTGCVDNTMATYTAYKATPQVRAVKRPVVSAGGNFYGCLPYSLQPRLDSCLISSTHTSPIVMNSNVYDVTMRMDDTASENSQSSESSRTPVNPEVSQSYQLSVEKQTSDVSHFEFPKGRKSKVKFPAEKSADAALLKPLLLDVSKQTQSSKPLLKQSSVFNTNCVPMERVQSDTVSISGSVPETDVVQLLGPHSIPSKLCRMIYTGVTWYKAF